jgi:hypothetical protein
MVVGVSVEIVAHGGKPAVNFELLQEHLHRKQQCGEQPAATPSNMPSCVEG